MYTHITDRQREDLLKYKKPKLISLTSYMAGGFLLWVVLAIGVLILRGAMTGNLDQGSNNYAVSNKNYTSTFIINNVVDKAAYVDRRAFREMKAEYVDEKISKEDFYDLYMSEIYDYLDEAYIYMQNRGLSRQAVEIARKSFDVEPLTDAEFKILQEEYMEENFISDEDIESEITDYYHELILEFEEERVAVAAYKRYNRGNYLWVLVSLLLTLGAVYMVKKYNVKHVKSLKSGPLLVAKTTLLGKDAKTKFTGSAKTIYYYFTLQHLGTDLCEQYIVTRGQFTSIKEGDQVVAVKFSEASKGIDLIYIEQ